MRKLIALTSFIVLWAGYVAEQGLTSEKRAARSLSTPFIKNTGQLDKEVAFHSNVLKGALFVTRSGKIVYSLPAQAKTIVLEEELVAGVVETVVGKNPSATRIHAFQGGDPKRWKNDLPAYSVVSLGEVYEGITIELHSRGSNIEKRFYIDPEGTAETIRMRVNGATGLTINSAGELVVETGADPVVFTRPIAFQEKENQLVPVEVDYSVEGITYGFAPGAYDRTRPMVIDPLIASTFLGASGGDSYCAITQDSEGNIYVAGQTLSQDFPTTPGVYDPDHNGNIDLFVACLTDDLTTLVSATFIGGSGADSSFYIERDEATGRLYVSGETNSIDFPVTPNAHDPDHNGNFDAFVLCLDSSLSTLVASTFLGGSMNERFCPCCLDGQGGVFVAGHTNSADFPVVPGAFDESFNGGSLINGEGVDYFVAKLNADLTLLEAATFLGGTGCEILRCVVVDTDGTVFVSGLTNSPDYPITANAFDATFHGGSAYNGDTLISRLDNNLSALLGSTYLGSSGDDWGIDMATDGDGKVYLTGDAFAGDFPTTPGAYDNTFHGGVYGDIIVLSMDADLTTLHASTFLGGSKGEYGIGLLLDEGDRILVCGITQSLDFPTTHGAFNMNYNGGERDCFIARLDRDLTTLFNCTYLGGKNYDTCGAMGSDEDRNIYVVGNTRSSDFPSTPGAYIGGYMGGIGAVSGDVFISKFDPDLSTLLFSDLDTFSCSQGGIIHFTLTAGEENANRIYLLLISLSGTEPGYLLPGGQATLPLNWDLYTSFCIDLINSTLFCDFLGTLDGSGNGAAQFNAPPLPLTLVGQTLHLAYALNKPFDFASNSVGIYLGW
ncbi:MAG: SBBP repeat-containing protein [Planctomycetota bacterium]